MNRPSDTGIAPAPVDTRRAAPVRVEPYRATGTPTVVAIVVTWNRREMADRAVHALAAQHYPLDRLHVIIVDNASTDGALDYLADRWRPERIIDNPTNAADEPIFTLAREADAPNAGGFASLTIVQNHENLGGCGGFNTGFECVRTLAADGLDVDFVWLVDDDALVAPNALDELVRPAMEDASIGIVGSRTVDMTDRRTTIESTIYFDFTRGRFADTPTPDHRLRAGHNDWIREVGAPKGGGEYSGVREVDVASASSLLARWSAAMEVGFWDTRYFIYCDDADWCLRFGRAGYRVVCNLDAVVYHTPWNHKLTPASVYYAQRNLVWAMAKILPAWRLRYATFRWLLAILRQSVKASTRRRPFQARVLMRTADDIMRNRGGKLDLADQPMIGELDALEEAGAIGRERTIVAICPTRRALTAASAIHARTTHALTQQGRSADAPHWTFLVRRAVQSHAGVVAPARTITYTSGRLFRMLPQVRFLTRPPHAVVIVNNNCDVPFWPGTTAIHIDTECAGMARIHRDNALARIMHSVRCATMLIRAAHYSLMRRPDPPTQSRT